jgi:predicted nucleic acid-binding protein
MYLLDTNVVSELRKAGTINPKVRAWAKEVQPSTLFLSTITILELEVGILGLESRDPSRAALLRHWLENVVLPAFNGRILPIDIPVARRSAAMHVPTPCSDRDALIAATALVHRMIVVTRNVSDFQPTGAPIINPWDAQVHMRTPEPDRI